MLQSRFLHSWVDKAPASSLRDLWNLDLSMTTARFSWRSIATSSSPDIFPVKSCHGISGQMNHRTNYSTVTQSCASVKRNLSELESEADGLDLEHSPVPQPVQSGPSNEERSALPFEAIPGPRRFPLFGNLLLYRMGPFSRYSIEGYHYALEDLYKQYGSIVKQDFGAGRVRVHIFSPDDFKTIFQNEGKTPLITPLQEAAQRYRAYRQLSLGLGNLNGEEWYRLRQAVQQMMMRPKAVQNFLPLAEVVAIDFVRFISQHRNSHNQIENFRDNVLQWSLESSGNIVFEKRLHAIGTGPDSLSQRMIDANQEAFRIAGLIKFGLPIHDYFPTRKWKRFVKSEDFFFGEAKKLFDTAIRDLKKIMEEGNADGASGDLSETKEKTSAFETQDDRYSFLRYLINRSELSLADVNIIAFSLFADGLNTTAPALIFNLYCLAKNPDVQQRLYQEIAEVIPANQPITPQVLSRLPYLKACVKESFRLYPIGTEFSRILPKDLVLSGYLVPAGTAVDINMNVHSKNPLYFDEPDRFLPERWLRGADKSHPFVLQPFGIGPRMCAGRRFAEQDLYLLISLLVQKFEIHHTKGAIFQIMRTLLIPAGNVQFSFIDRR